MWKVVACIFLLGCFTFMCFANESLEKKDGPPCGKNSTKPTGRIHLNIKNFTGECVWYIKPDLNGTANATISLFFHFLYLYDGDSVTVFKAEADVSNDNLSIIAPLQRQNGSVTIITKETKLFIKFKGDPKAPYQRNFDGVFHGHVCNFPITPDMKLINSPIYPNGMSGDIGCVYVFNKDQHYRTTASFTFEEFKITSSEVSLSQATKDGPYTGNPPIDFFPLNDQPMEITVKMTVPNNDSFRLLMHEVDYACFGYLKYDNIKQVAVHSPQDQFNNGTIIPECRWVIEHTDSSKTLGVMLDTLHLEGAMDIIAINDGASELSPPLIQVTASTGNITKNIPVRTTGPRMWIAFKPKTYASKILATITAIDQGGYFKESGSIEMKSTDAQETIFLLEVKEDQLVLVKFDDSSDFPLPGTLSIYDGFDKSNLLATLHGKVWYPVVSKSSKMMMVATQFVKGSFKANFQGVSPSCLHMGTFYDENYILTGNCNTTCIWVIPPQDQPNTNLMVNLQYLALNKNDAIKIRKLDAAKTVLGDVGMGVTHVPQVLVPANVGALVEITRAVCAKQSEDVAVVGHSSYLPACGYDLNPSPPSTFQISSPLHPDTYPIYANCRWNLTVPKDTLLHLAFNSMQLAPGHCVKITHSVDNKTEQYEGNAMQGDLLLTMGAVVEFDSGKCTKAEGAADLVSARGFVVNGTVADCGSVLSGKNSGTLSVPANKTLCIWKVSVPEMAKDASDIVNIISYSVTKKDDAGNYNLDVFDGDSVRSSRILNETKAEVWSRTNNLIFVYRRIDVAKVSTLLTIQFETIGCNSTMQCDNKICMHPNWRCNGVNNCGDFTDERNCNTVPVPPVIKMEGYSTTTFWITIFVMLSVGIVIGFGIPLCYQRYRNGQYRRFGEISIIE